MFKRDGVPQKSICIQKKDERDSILKRCLEVKQRDAPRLYSSVIAKGCGILNQCREKDRVRITREIDDCLDILETKLNGKWIGWARKVREENILNRVDSKD